MVINPLLDCVVITVNDMKSIKAIKEEDNILFGKGFL